MAHEFVIYTAAGDLSEIFTVVLNPKSNEDTVLFSKNTAERTKSGLLECVLKSKTQCLIFVVGSQFCVQKL